MRYPHSHTGSRVVPSAPTCYLFSCLEHCPPTRGDTSPKQRIWSHMREVILAVALWVLAIILIALIVSHFT
jgi:hypothetical protein